MTSRRRWLGQAAALALGSSRGVSAAVAAPAFTRVRPGDAAWPDADAWAALSSRVGGSLLQLASPWDACRRDAAACAQLFAWPQNPYAIGDDPALTQSAGWVDAWASQTSPWAVAARSSADVAAAVDFARANRLRLAIKGGGHSYHGTSNAADSLLVWTRRLHDAVLHDAFVPQGCAGRVAATRAVSIGAGAMWSQAYDAVTTRGGGYVQGGGCMTVGVAGLVQSGGFGSFSKAFGTAAASLLQAEVVTADGVLRTVNACNDPDLFWALKGGGGGSFGIVTRLTLRVHDLPQRFGAVNFTVRAASDAAFRRLVGLVLDFCAAQLVDPHWGEQIRLRPDNVVAFALVFQGLDRSTAVDLWQPFIDAVSTDGGLSIDFAPLKIVTTSARDFWAPTLVKRALGFIARDDRPGAAATNVYWPGDRDQAGRVLHAYQSGWLPAALLRPEQRRTLADALFDASRHARLSLHLNKGLAGARQPVLDAVADTATNPAVRDAFALLICAAEGPPAHPGVPGHAPDAAAARRDSARLQAAVDALQRNHVELTGAYVSESDYFQRDWQQAYWGANHARLAAVKRRYDPDGLFVVHHGVGSENWSGDGFTRA